MPAPLVSLVSGHLIINACKGNKRVCCFYERFGAVRVGETEQDYLYGIDQEKNCAAREHYKKYLPENITVEQGEFT